MSNNLDPDQAGHFGGPDLAKVISSPHYVSKNYFSYFSTKTYVVGNEKNRLNEKFF